MTVVSRRSVLLTGGCFAVSACGFPRNAPQRREVLKVAEGEIPDFTLREVRRDALQELRGWPRVGARAGLPWPANSGGNRAPIVAAGDTVDLRIWDAEETSLITSPGMQMREMNGLVVSPAGTVFLPYVNQVRVAGLTADGARRNVQEAMTAISPSAQVQLIHTAGRRNSMDMVSGVAKPGTYPIAETAITLLSMISVAGGVAEGLTNPQVRLMRGGKMYQASLAWIYDAPARDIVLQGNDRVIIEPDKRSFTALGATGKQALITFDKDDVSALEAVSMMGGVNDTRADLKGILILRSYPAGRFGKPGQPPTERVVFALDMTNADGLFSAGAFHIMPGDVVLATQSVVTTAERVFALLGRAFSVAGSAANL